MIWLPICPCLLYTSDAADDSLRVDLGGRRIIKKKNFFKQKTAYEISACLVGSEMCIRDRVQPDARVLRDERVLEGLPGLDRAHDVVGGDEALSLIHI